MAGSHAPEPADADLRQLLAESTARGWRAFIDRYTPAIVSLVERAGLRDRDEAMELYTLVCERLAENDCARLRRWNPAKGSLKGWLAVVVRRVTVDWVRSRAGRRRLFGVVKNLGPLERRVFELYYWEDRSPATMSEMLAVERGQPVSLIDVLTALDTIHGVLSARHYAELLSTAARSQPHASLDADLEAGTLDPVDPAASADASLGAEEQNAGLEAALGSLAPEDAAIVRLHYLEGLSLAAVRQALHLQDLTRARVEGILGALKSRLAGVASPEESRRGPSLA